MIPRGLRSARDDGIGHRRESHETRGISTPAGREAEVRAGRVVGAVALLGRLVDAPVAADGRAGAVARARPGAGGMIGPVTLLARLVHDPVPAARGWGRAALHEGHGVADGAVL